MKKLLLLALLPNLLFASVGRFKHVVGKVTYTVNKKKVDANKKTKIHNNGIVETSKKSLAVLRLNDGSSIKLGPNSKFKINNVEKSDTTEASLYRGEAFINVLKKKVKSMPSDKKRTFKLKTKTAAMGVRGTTFFVSYGTKSSDVWMCVNDGKVEVATKKKRVLVNEGEGVVASPGSVSEPKPLAWTKKLNWNMNPGAGSLENTVSIEEAYTDLLEHDYD